MFVSKKCIEKIKYERYVRFVLCKLKQGLLKLIRHLHASFFSWMCRLSGTRKVSNHPTTDNKFFHKCGLHTLPLQITVI